jgi:hypothetical protein
LQGDDRSRGWLPPSPQLSADGRNFPRAFLSGRVVGAAALEDWAFSEQAFRRFNWEQVAIYYRVSTDDQSCERQERDLRAFAKRAGREIGTVFKETASGAKNDRSP